MFEMGFDSIIRSVYDMNKPEMISMDYDTGEQIAKGLLFAFDVSVSYWNKEEEYNERRKLYVALGPHKAWCAETSFARNSRDDLMALNWVNVGNHDSCWINSVESWLNAVYFNMCHAVADDIEDNECHIYTHEPMCEKLFRPIKLKFTRGNDKYRRELLDIEFCDLQTV